MVVVVVEVAARQGEFLETTAEVFWSLARSPNLWHHHPAWGVAVALFIAFWLVALGVGRRWWAWLALLLVSLSTVVSPLWGEWHGVRPYAFNVISAGLLLTPQMRRYVGVRWPRHRLSTPGR